MRRTIAVDLDGCLFDFIGGLCNHLQANHNITVSPSQFTSPDLRDFPVHLPTHVYEDVRKQLSNPQFYGSLLPIPGAISAIQKLSSHVKLIAITSRPTSTTGVTAVSVESNFGPFFLHDENGWPAVYHVDTKRKDSKKKARIAKRFNAKYAIEDHPGLAQEYAAAKIHTYVPAHPYNSELPKSKYIHRVNTLRDAADHITRYVDLPPLEI